MAPGPGAAVLIGIAGTGAEVFLEASLLFVVRASDGERLFMVSCQRASSTTRQAIRPSGCRLLYVRDRSTQESNEGGSAMLRFRKLAMPSKDDAPPGRAERMPVPDRHAVNNAPLVPPFPAGMQMAMFGMGCFWGAERKFWETNGVDSTAVGYAGGFTPKPTYV